MLAVADSFDVVDSCAPSNEDVRRLERIIAKAPQTDLGTRHFVVRSPHGVTLYGREISIPAGTILTGAEHKTDHAVTVTGDITVTTDQGVKRLSGSHTFVAKRGGKRAGLAWAPTKWTTWHVVRAETIADIEVELTDEFEVLQTRVGLVAPDVDALLGGAS